MSPKLLWLRIKESFLIPALSSFHSSSKTYCFIHNTGQAVYSWVKEVLYGKCEEPWLESNLI